jgi:hypothetical protein
MEPVADRPVEIAAESSTKRELDLVRASIALVADGGARRVTHVRLRHAEEVARNAVADGGEAGVIVRTVWHGPQVGYDVVVESIA